MKNNKYWIQKVYCIVCPDGTAYDYVYSKKEADKIVKQLNKDCGNIGMEG
jgi:hypothetical protein